MADITDLATFSTSEKAIADFTETDWDVQIKRRGVNKYESLKDLYHMKAVHEAKFADLKGLIAGTTEPGLIAILEEKVQIRKEKYAVVCEQIRRIEEAEKAAEK